MQQVLLRLLEKINMRAAGEERMADWSRRISSLLDGMVSDGYVAAKYLDSNGTLLHAEHLAAFAVHGVMPEGEIIKLPNSLLGWSLDARVPTFNPDVTDAPWCYNHCFLQAYAQGRLTSSLFLAVGQEWTRTRPVFGSGFHDSGAQLLAIAEAVHRTPEQYEDVPYIDVRSGETANYLELLAYSEGCWFSVFLTDSLLAGRESIITLSFTPRSVDDPSLPPNDDENLLSFLE